MKYSACAQGALHQADNLAKLWQEFLSLLELIAKILCAVEIARTSAMLSNKLPFIASIATPFEQLCTFQQQLVCDERDKFAVGGFFVGSVNFDAENVVYIFNFTSVPCNFDCVANGTFDF